MNCLAKFAKTNPCSVRVLSSCGSSRLAYLIKYLVFQQRKWTRKTERVVITQTPTPDADWCKNANKKDAGITDAALVMESFAAIYLGCVSTKQIYRVAAFGDIADKLQAYTRLTTQPLVEITNLKRGP